MTSTEAREKLLQLSTLLLRARTDWLDDHISDDELADLLDTAADVAFRLAVLLEVGRCE